MEQLIPIAIFLSVLFLLLGSGVWIGLALMGVAYSPRGPRATR